MGWTDNWTVTLLWLFFLRISDVTAGSSHNNCLMRRAATQNGFHRDLTTDVVFTNFPLTADDNCSIALIESIPAGLYADLYQLKSEEEFGGPQVYSPVDIDVEKPEYLSPSHTLYVFGSLSGGATSQGLHWSVTVPVHLRYHRPQVDQDMARVELQPPRILLRCADNDKLKDVGKPTPAPCHHQQSQQCSWQELACQQDAPLEFQVAVGRQEHQFIVVLGTLAVTVGATLLLSYVIISRDFTDDDKVQKLKKDK